MSTIYLVRHSQAGTRDAYDSLSELGKRQARLLGNHFASQAIHFAAAYSGELSGQRQTAEQIRTAHTDAGILFPSIEIDRGWSEFNLEQVSSELAPHLCAQEVDFRHDYEEMLQQVRISRGTHAATVHRKWLPCDTKIVEAWVRGRFPYSGETWSSFVNAFCLAAQKSTIARSMKTYSWLHPRRPSLSGPALLYRSPMSR